MRLLLFCLFLLIYLPLQAQEQYLALENLRKYYRVSFRPGDEFAFKTFDSKAKFSGTLKSVNDSILVLIKTIPLEDGGTEKHEDAVPLEEIKSVYFVKDSYWQFFRSMYGGGATIGGAFLMGIAGFNHLTDRDGTRLDTRAMGIAAGIMLSGVIVFLAGGKKYKKLGDKWRLRSIQAFDPGTPTPSQP